MSGKPGRSGRRPLSIAELIKRGTYRRDRHAHRATQRRDRDGHLIDPEAVLDDDDRDRLLDELPKGQQEIVEALTLVYWNWPNSNLQTLLAYARQVEQLAKLRKSRNPNLTAIRHVRKACADLLVVLELTEADVKSAIARLRTAYAEQAAQS